MHLLHPHLVWQTFLRCREFKKHITLLLLLFILRDWRLSLVTLMFRFCSGFFGASYSNSSWKMHGQVNLLCNLNIHVSIEVKVILAVRLQQDSNLWPPWYQCDALPTELSSLTGSRSGASSIYTCYYILIWFLSYICTHHMSYKWECLWVCCCCCFLLFFRNRLHSTLQLLFLRDF